MSDHRVIVSDVYLESGAGLRAGPHSAEQQTKAFSHVLASKTPPGRLGRVTDIAPLAVFLASDESAWITGEVIRAAGGLVVAT